MDEEYEEEEYKGADNRRTQAGMKKTGNLFSQKNVHNTRSRASKTKMDEELNQNKDDSLKGYYSDDDDNTPL